MLYIIAFCHLSIFIFTSNLFLCCCVSLVETTGDPPLKATDSSAAAKQDASDKQYKKASFLNLWILIFALCTLPLLHFTQLPLDLATLHFSGKNAGRLIKIDSKHHIHHFKLPLNTALSIFI